MPYATTQNAITLYGDTYVLTSVVREDTPSDEALDDALAKASDQMDSYLGAVYSVPLSTVPDVVKRFCIDMAIYIASGEAGVVTEEKRKRYEDAISWLKSIAKGEAVIPGVSDEEEDDASGGLPTLTTSTRLFSRTTMGEL